MNRQVMALVLLLLIPAAAFSQDDIYFVPSEEHHPAAYAETVAPAPVNAETYYSGSTRDVDEYNRRGTYVQQIDSAGNDIIDFDGSMGVYPDSACDYECTRQMSRFDDYDWAALPPAAGILGGGTIRGITVHGIMVHGIILGAMQVGIIVHGVTTAGILIIITGMLALITGLITE